MTVQDVQRSQSYVADGIITSFAFNFRIDDVNWVVVNFTDDLAGISLNLDQDSSPGGSVNYSVAPPNLQDITIDSVVPQTQQLDYTRYDPFDSESHENALDKLTMEIQELTEGTQASFDIIVGTIIDGTVNDSCLRWDVSANEWLENIHVRTSPGRVVIYDEATGLIPIFYNNNVVAAGIFWDATIANGQYRFGESAGGSTVYIDGVKLALMSGKAIRFVDAVTEAEFANVFYSSNLVAVTSSGNTIAWRLQDLDLDMFGNAIRDYTVQDQSPTSASGVLTIDYKLGQSVYLVMSEDITSTVINNWPSAGLAVIEIEILQDSTARTLVWPAAVIWIGGNEPDLSVDDATYLVRLRSRNGGTSIMGTFGEDFS